MNLSWRTIPRVIEKNFPFEGHAGDRGIWFGWEIRIGTTGAEGDTHARDKNTARLNIGTHRPRSIVGRDLGKEQVEKIERRPRSLETENLANLDSKVDRKANLESGVVGNVGREPLGIHGESFIAIGDRSRAVVGDRSVRGRRGSSLTNDRKTIHLEAHRHLYQKHWSHRAFTHDGSKPLNKVCQSWDGFCEIKRDDKSRRGVQPLLRPQFVRRVSVKFERLGKTELIAHIQKALKLAGTVAGDQSGGTTLS